VITLAPGVTPTAIAAGNDDGLAIGSDGNLYAWGDNADGDLGDGSNAEHNSPELITLAQGVTPTAISAGDGHDLAVSSHGALYAWGYNSGGELGDGSTTDDHSPEAIQLGAVTTATDVAAGTDDSFAIGAYSPPPPPSGASSSSSGAASSYPNNVATASNAGTTVTGAGDGALTLAQYPSNPAAAASFTSSGQYFDVAVSSTNEFSSLVIRHCALNGGDAFEWFNPSANSGAGAWQPVVGDPGPSDAAGPPGCVSVTLDATTSPSLSQLGGTVFAVATGLPAATPEAPLIVVLPASGIALMGAWCGLRRRRTRTA
jgi:hypothetical protein